MNDLKLYYSQINIFFYLDVIYPNKISHLKYIAKNMLYLESHVFIVDRWRSWLIMSVM